MHHIPLALVLLRLLLSLAILALGVARPDQRGFAVCLVVGVLSDYFDGVIARRLGVATPTLRRLDSVVDTIFYLSAVTAVLLNFPELLRPYVMPLVLLVLVEAARYAYDFKKFGKEANRRRP